MTQDYSHVCSIVDMNIFELVDYRFFRPLKYGRYKGVLLSSASSINVVVIVIIPNCIVRSDTRKYFGKMRDRLISN